MIIMILHDRQQLLPMLITFGFFGMKIKLTRHDFHSIIIKSGADPREEEEQVEDAMTGSPFHHLIIINCR